MEEHERHITGSLEFATALFEPATVERFIACFRQILQEMAANPARPVHELPMLPAAERHQVLDGWNDAALREVPAAYAHCMIAEQAARTPERVALVHGARTLTYAELERGANRLAHHLRALGVRGGERIGLCVERGPSMVLGVLAVLKAGAAYVPLDPSYPAARLRLMLADSAPAVLLTQASMGALGAELGIPTVDIDRGEDWQHCPESALAPEEVGLRPGSLAYLIYTSGSTGTPKGVMLQHSNLTNFLGWGREAFPAGLLAHTLAATSLSFDLAVFECLLPLTCGGAVHIVGNVLELADADVPVTLVNTVPSALEGLLDAGALPATTRVVNLAGEALRPGLVERIFASSSVEAVCNLYGPTETTTYSTWTRIGRGEAFGGHIGRPIANTRIYILDAHGQPVPVGVAGELYIGGAGVALRRRSVRRHGRRAHVPHGRPGALA
jgi:amino acid adenylation domain-containing protein